MKGYVIPDGNHVVRYCLPRFVDRQTGLPERDAFRLNRAKAEETLSVNWLEYFDYSMTLATRDERESAVDKVRTVMQYDRDAKGRFAFLGVADLKRAVEEGGGAEPFVEHDPQGPQAPAGRRAARGPDASHALVYGFPDDDRGVGVELRALVVSNTDLNLFPGVSSP